MLMSYLNKRVQLVCLKRNVMYICSFFDTSILFIFE